jgi:signal transduction histidine kinase
VTDISGEDGPLAVLVHDPALCDDEGLLDAVAGAAQLSLENERLAAQVRAQLDAVRDSRRRIVRAGEREQLRIERDLHRGAVQRLVGVSLALRMAADEAGEDPGTLALLNSAIGEAQGALVDLRELARGLHPEILTQDGLDAALRTLADRSPLPVHADLSVSTRLDPGVEGCAYFVCSEAFANIDKYAHATKVGLRIGLSAGHLVMTVSDDGVGGAHLGNGSGLIGLRDRVQALGGVLAVDSAPGQGTTIEMRLPAIVVAAPALA